MGGHLFLEGTGRAVEIDKIQLKKPGSEENTRQIIVKNFGARVECI